MTNPKLTLVETLTSARTYHFQATEPLGGWALCTVNDGTGELLDHVGLGQLGAPVEPQASRQPVPHALHRGSPELRLPREQAARSARGLGARR